MSEGDSAGARLRDWLIVHRIPFELIEDPKSHTAPVTVLERLTGKSIRFAFGAVQRIEEAKNPEGGTTYLRVFLDDGRIFAFAGVGIVFSPSFASTGPLADCPATACFLDYGKLHRHLEHLVSDAHEGYEREALQVLFVLLAFLEGARAIGLDVAGEERELEGILKDLENLGVKV